MNFDVGVEHWIDAVCIESHLIFSSSFKHKIFGWSIIFVHKWGKMHSFQLLHSCRFTSGANPMFQVSVIRLIYANKFKERLTEEKKIFIAWFVL